MPGANKWLMPAVIAVAAILVIVGGYFAYNAFFAPPMSAADYKAQVIKYTDIMNSTGGASSDVMSQIASTDPAARATAKAAWDKVLSDTRSAMAGIRALRPPAEYASIHDRLIKGIAAADRVITAYDAFIQKVASGAITQDNASDSAEYKAIEALNNDATIEADSTGFTTALDELKAK
jgi:hypothetical protein